jgi:3-deoxy-manno-octulosonate cytidylyltransferase (CMP-KDO synthetase)
MRRPDDASPSADALGVVPARYGSTRFPGKPLALIAGKPMIQHVWERARAARRLDAVVVATDDDRIRRVVEEFGGEVMMTSPDHPTGTDRLAEVARIRRASIYVNIQGDEPLLEPADLDVLVAGMAADPATGLGTLAVPLDDPRAAQDPNLVKVVCDGAGRALYFSRAPIPFPRHPPASGAATPGAWPPAGGTLRHIGLYAYRRDLLLQFAGWAPTPLETTEGLEQLRALEHGCAIRVFPARGRYLAVDTPEDRTRVESALSAVAKGR